MLILVLALAVGCSSAPVADAPAADTTESPAPATPAEEAAPVEEAPAEETKSEEAKKPDSTSGHGGVRPAAVEIPELAFDQVPQRVAVGTVGLSELFDALEIDLVGVPSSKSYSVPARYDQATRVGMSMRPDFEILKSLDLDVFISDASFAGDMMGQLEEKNIGGAFLKTSSYADIKASIGSLGQAFEKQEQAQKMLDNMKKLEDEAKALADGQEKKTVMVIFGTPESFMLATDYSFVGDLAQKIGMDNVTDASKMPAPFMPFSNEAALKMNPDVILRLTHADPETSKKMFDKEFSENPIWQAMEAVKTNQVYDLDPHYFGVVANIRGAEAMKKLAEMVYGQ